MPDRRRQAVDRNLFFLETEEMRAARQVAQAYNQSRRELVRVLLERWLDSGKALTPGQAVDLLRRMAILGQVDANLLALERELGVILRDVVQAQDEAALKAVRREMAALPKGVVDIVTFSRVETQLIERFVPIAMADLELGTQAVRLQLRRELQSGLIQGESFPDLVRRLFNESEPSVWRNGRLSTERMVRRTVIHANNAAKQGFLEQAQRDLPEIQKQAVASIGPRTTDCCLAVHGQIQPLDKPFKLTAKPRFADEMMHPGFHWNCRTSITMWHPAFEQGGFTTESMLESAKAEKRRRRS